MQTAESSVQIKINKPEARCRAPAFPSGIVRVRSFYAVEMPPKAQSDKCKINAAIRAHGERVFAHDETLGKSKLFCRLCSTSVNFSTKWTIAQHTNSATHQENLAKLQEVLNKEPVNVDSDDETQRQPKSKRFGVAAAGARQQLLVESIATSESETAKQKLFNRKLCEAFVSADIPLSKLDEKTLTDFLVKFTGMHIVDESTLRRCYVEPVFQQKLERIRSALNGRYLYVSMDETMDTMKRSVVNVVVGAMSGTDLSEPFLVHVAFLDKPADSTAMCHIFSEAMNVLFGVNIQYMRVLLFVSDGAAYMKKCAHSLKSFYPNMVFVTCLAHGFHRVAEEIRASYKAVNQLVASVKKVFKKSPARIATFRDVAPHTPLPPEPVLTRWGTWIKAVLYYSTNIDVVEAVLQRFDDDDAACIPVAKAAVCNKDVRNQLAAITQTTVLYHN